MSYKMRPIIFVLLSCGIACSAPALASSLGKGDTGQYTEFGVPNEPWAAGKAINNHGTIAGVWDDGSNLAHGFVRANDGTVTTFDVKGALVTIPSRINDKGTIVGFYQDRTLVPYGFIRKPTGKLIRLAKEQTRFIDDINTRGDICGSLQDHQAFVRTADGTVTEIDPPGAVSSFAAAINDDGTIAGSFNDAAGQSHGFMRSADGTITTFDVPNSASTSVWDMNATGVIVGTYADSSGALHGFLRDAAGAINRFKLSKTQVITEVDGLSINSKGFVAGHFRDPVTQGFIAFERKPSGGMIDLEPPGNVYAVGATDISDHDIIVGFFYPSDDQAHGYFRVP